MQRYVRAVVRELRLDRAGHAAVPALRGRRHAHRAAARAARRGARPACSRAPCRTAAGVHTVETSPETITPDAHRGAQAARHRPREHGRPEPGRGRARRRAPRADHGAGARLLRPARVERAHRQRRPHLRPARPDARRRSGPTSPRWRRAGSRRSPLTACASTSARRSRGRWRDRRAVRPREPHALARLRRSTARPSSATRRRAGTPSSAWTPSRGTTSGCPRFDRAMSGYQLGVGMSARSQLGYTVYRNHDRSSRTWSASRRARARSSRSS